MARHRMCTLILASVFSIAAATDRAVISGRVVDSAGRPVQNASVIVYAAGVRVGYSTFCPTCYTDCGKRAFTSDVGEYRIASLDPALRFQLLVVREGYEPQFLMKVDPAAGRTPDAVLLPRPPVSEAARILHGKVVDTAGAPLRDALVRPEAIASHFEAGRYRYDESPRDADRLVVTNGKGEFDIYFARPVAAMTVMVEARGMAPKRFADLPTDVAGNTLKVADGALVRGRLLDRDRPVAGAEIILSHRNQMAGYEFSEIRIGTREDGTFLIPNVPPHEDWYLSAAMQSIANRGAVSPRKLASAGDGEEVDAGDLQMRPGLHLRGRVQLTDGKTIPAGISVRISQYCFYCGEEMAIHEPSGATVFLRNYQLHDFQTVPLLPDGRFEFQGLPAGPYTVITAIPGYELEPPYNVLKPLDIKPDEEPQWSAEAESAATELKREAATEIRIDKNLDLAVKLHPAPAR
ncbi:MAG TPA: carboxypeptidase-like regulatory domain-containing protein [Bryobacteraceae bacterium]|nr:carboxypeptidase-like regulatory domain-containing protein [Bryobacteraceae bacterium]